MPALAYAAFEYFLVLIRLSGWENNFSTYRRAPFDARPTKTQNPLKTRVLPGKTRNSKGSSATPSSYPKLGGNGDARLSSLNKSFTRLSRQAWHYAPDVARHRSPRKQHAGMATNKHIIDMARRLGPTRTARLLRISTRWVYTLLARWRRHRNLSTTANPSSTRKNGATSAENPPANRQNQS